MPPLLGCLLAPRYSSISVESPADVQDCGLPSQADFAEPCDKSFATTLEFSGKYSAADAGSVVDPGTGAAANFAFFKWSGRHNSALGKFGVPPAQSFPAIEGFKFGNGRVGEVRFSADILAWTAGGRGEVAAFLMDADIPALLRKGEPQYLGRQLDPPRNVSTFGRLAAGVPLKVIGAGHFVLSAASFGEERNSLGNGLTQSTSWFAWDTSMKRPALPRGGLHFPCAEDGLNHIGPPVTPSACKAVAFGDAVNPRLSGPKKIDEVAFSFGLCLGAVIETCDGGLGRGDHGLIGP